MSRWTRFTLRDLMWLFVSLGCLLVSYPTGERCYQQGFLDGQSANWQQVWGAAREREHEYYEAGWDDALTRVLNDGTFGTGLTGTVMFPVRQQGQRHWWMMVVDREADAQTGRLSVGIMMPGEVGFWGDLPVPQPGGPAFFSTLSAMDDGAVGTSIMQGGERVDWSQEGGRERALELRRLNSDVQLWLNQQPF